MSGQQPQGTPNPTPTPPEVNWDQVIPVTTDGVTQMKSLREVANGYAAGAKMHQANEEAAALRKELEAHKSFLADIESDPAAHVARINEHFQLTPASDTSGADEGASMAMAEIAKLRADMAKMAGNAATLAQNSELQQQLARVQAADPSIDPAVLQTYAQQKGVDNLEHAALMMKGELGTGAPAPTQATPQQDAFEALRDRKAAALGAVAPGANAAAGGQQEAPKGPAKSVVESLSRALEHHGTNMDELLSQY